MISRRLAPLLLAFATATTVGVTPGIARADGPTPAELKKARTQFQRGIELEQASNWSEALQLFRDVGQVRMTPQVRFHIAYCEEGLGRLVTALGGYELAQAEADQVGADFKNEVETAVTSLRARIPKLFIERGPGADAALVQLDGVDLGATSVGVEVPLDPGPHSVGAAAPGFLPFSATVELKEREVTRVTLELTPEPVESSDKAGQVVVVAPPPSANRTLPYVIGGVGIAGLVTSGVFFALRQATAAELDKDCPNHDQCPESNKPTYDRLKTYNLATWIAGAVGIAGIGTAAVLILTEKKPQAKKSDEAAGLWLKPSAPGALAGVELDYRF
jgi:PEGA domain-containing protein